MNANTLNRTVLAALIGSALSVGLSAPQSALARPPQERAAHGQAQPPAEQSQDDEKAAREKREQARKDREAAAARNAPPTPRTEDSAREQPQVQPREREQAQQQVGQRQEQEELRDQQAQIREQNRLTRERNEQLREAADAQRERQMGEREREQAQAEAQRERAERVQRDSQAQAELQRERASQRGDAAQDRERQQQEREAQRDDRRGDQQQAADLRQRSAEQRQQATEQRRQANEQRQEHGPLPQEDFKHNLPPARRLDNRQRDQRIVREKHQAQQYQQAIKTQVAPQAKAYAESLNHQHRSHGYRYQQQYYWRLLEMLTRWNWQSYNYWNDPYYSTADDYRYYRGGSWYTINRYGADILRQAINYGYQEGYWAGRADHEDGWRYDYRSSWVYRDANYGYRGYYVGQREYNYYFREGFRRGYEDGFYSHRRYGRSYNGSDVILGGVLSTILNLQAYRW